VIGDGQIYPNGYQKKKIKLSILKNIMLDIMCFSKYPPFMEEKMTSYKMPFNYSTKILSGFYV